MQNNGEVILDILNIFANTIFYIPSMQRRYDWKEKNASQAANDLYQQFLRCLEGRKDPLDNRYYFYDISRTHYPNLAPGDGNNVYEINDGIQRLTTLILFCYAIWLFAISHNISKTIIDQIKTKLELNFLFRDADDVTIQRTRLGYNLKKFPNMINALDRITLLSYEKISGVIKNCRSSEERKDAIKDLIASFFDPQEEILNLRFQIVFEALFDVLSDYFTFKEEKLNDKQLNIFNRSLAVEGKEELNNIEEARLFSFFNWILKSQFQVRTIMSDQQKSEFRKRNDRGLKLSATNLLKAEIITNLPDSQEFDFNVIWSKLENCIEKHVINKGKLPKKNIKVWVEKYDESFEQILKSFATVYYLDSEDEVSSKDIDGVYDYIVDKENDETFKSSYLKPRMHSEPLKYAEFLFNFANSYLNVEKSLIPNRSESIDLREFKFWQRNPALSTINMIMAVNAWSSEHQQRIVENVVKTLFVRSIFIPKSLSKDKLYETFSNCIEILRKTIQGDEESSIKQVEDILKNRVLSRYLTPEFFNAELKYSPDNNASIDNENEEISEINEKTDTVDGRHGTNRHINYVLYRVDHYIGKIREGHNPFSAPFRDDKIFRNDRKDDIKYEIEHIAPQKWREYTKSWNLENNFDEHDIGNLMLLTKNQNSRLQPYLNFDEKRRIYREFTEWNLAQNIAGNLPTVKSGQFKNFSDGIPKFNTWNKETVHQNRKYILTQFLLAMGYSPNEIQNKTSKKVIIEEVKTYNDYFLEMAHVSKEINRRGRIITIEKTRDFLVDLKIVEMKDAQKYSTVELQASVCALMCAQILIDKIVKFGANDEKGKLILYRRLNDFFPKDLSHWGIKENEIKEKHAKTLNRFRNMSI